MYFYIRGYEPPVDIDSCFLEYDIFIPEDSNKFHVTLLPVGDDYKPKDTLRLVPGMCKDISEDYFRPKDIVPGRWCSVKIDLSKYSRLKIGAIAILLRLISNTPNNEVCFYLRNICLRNKSRKIDLLSCNIGSSEERQRVIDGQWTETFSWGSKRWWGKARLMAIDDREILMKNKFPGDCK